APRIVASPALSNIGSSSFDARMVSSLIVVENRRVSIVDAAIDMKAIDGTRYRGALSTLTSVIVRRPTL
ncbi:MAG TPA: hypothetical protein VJ884_00810, partial [Salinibacter sp.]|nr:hypothetical protein [Salinibacter sp.]